MDLGALWSSYISSIISLYLLITTILFVLRVGPSSPPGMEKSSGRIRNFCGGGVVKSWIPAP